MDKFLSEWPHDVTDFARAALAAALHSSSWNDDLPTKAGGYVIKSDRARFPLRKSEDLLRQKLCFVRALKAFELWKCKEFGFEVVYGSYSAVVSWRPSDRLSISCHHFRWFLSLSAFPGKFDFCNVNCELRPGIPGMSQLDNKFRLSRCLSAVSCTSVTSSLPEESPTGASGNATAKCRGVVQLFLEWLRCGFESIKVFSPFVFLLLLLSWTLPKEKN